MVNKFVICVKTTSNRHGKNVFCFLTIDSGRMNSHKGLFHHCQMLKSMVSLKSRAGSLGTTYWVLKKSAFQCVVSGRQNVFKNERRKNALLMS